MDVSIYLCVVNQRRDLKVELEGRVRGLWAGIPHPLRVVCHYFARSDNGGGGEFGAFGGAVGVRLHGLVLVGVIGRRGAIVVYGGRRLESSNCKGHDWSWLRVSGGKMLKKG